MLPKIVSPKSPSGMGMADSWSSCSIVASSWTCFACESWDVGWGWLRGGAPKRYICWLINQLITGGAHIVILVFIMAIIILNYG